MERLTNSGTKEAKNNTTIREVIERLAEYEDFEEIFREKMTETACEFLKDKEEFGKWLERNHWIAKKCDEWVRAEEQGLLLWLPCKVGDTLYVNGVLGVGEAEEYKVIRVDYHSNLSTKRSEFYIEALLLSDPRNSIGFYDKEFGKTVFLTKAEAEKKLKEIEE